MPRIRITLTCTREYELDPTCHQPNATPEEMLEVAIKTTEEDPILFLDMREDPIRVTGRILPSDEERESMKLNYAERKLVAKGNELGAMRMMQERLECDFGAAGRAVDRYVKEKKK